jgi:predicted transcriptional regulator
MNKDSKNLDDCHMLFIFDSHLNKCIWDINDSDISFYLALMKKHNNITASVGEHQGAENTSFINCCAPQTFLHGFVIK